MAAFPARSAFTAALVLAIAMPAAAATNPSRTGDPLLDMLLSSVEMERRGVLEDLEEFDRISGQASRAESDLNASLNQIARLERCSRGPSRPRPTHGPALRRDRTGVGPFPSDSPSTSAGWRRFGTRWRAGATS
jgi:hypothetical protein